MFEEISLKGLSGKSLMGMCVYQIWSQHTFTLQYHSEVDLGPFKYKVSSHHHFILLWHNPHMNFGLMARIVLLRYHIDEDKQTTWKHYASAPAVRSYSWRHSPKSKKCSQILFLLNVINETVLLSVPSPKCVQQTEHTACSLSVV